MSTQFDLQSHVDYLYQNKPKRLAFQAETLAVFEQWQQELRAEVLNILGLAGRKGIPVQAKKLQTIDRGNYVEEKYALDVGEGTQAPYVFIGSQKRGAI